MNILIKGRAVFAVVSILALAVVAMFGGPGTTQTNPGQTGMEQRKMIEQYLRQHGFISIIKGIAEGKEAWDMDGPWQKGHGRSPEKQEDDDTYGEDDDEASDSWLGSRYVLGFYVDDEYIHPSSYDRMVKHSENISAVAPFWYRLSPANGSKLQEHHPQEDFTVQEKNRIINKAHQQNMEVLMLIHNLLYGGKANGKELAKQMLATNESRKAFIDSVEANLKEFNYDGINMDIESIYVADRDRFSALIKELYERLSPEGYKVTVCVPAKTGDNPANTWSGPFDYREIAKYSDKVAIMTYDEHGYSSGPGPVASYNWVEEVMEYAVGEIPAEKILMGIPGYGFDWTAGKTGAGYISYSQAMSLSASRGASVQWDETARVPYFRYSENGQSHEVWFESRYSLEHKLDIAKEFDIGGIALWRIGLEDAGIWETIDKRIEAEK
jgi:spore germination protein YaaH